MTRPRYEDKSGAFAPRYPNIGLDCGSTLCGTIQMASIASNIIISVQKPYPLFFRRYNILKINAKYFGEISYEQKETIHVINGLFGFESYTEYLPLPFNEYNDSLISLQSLENDNLSFILMNPFGIYPDYKPTLSDQDLEDLGADSEDDISYYVTSVILDSLSESTVDLKAPLAVNGFTRKAKQIILDNPDYTFRHTLSSLVHEGEVE